MPSVLADTCLVPIHALCRRFTSFTCSFIPSTIDVNAQFDTTTPVGRAMRRISGVFDELDYENIIHQLAEGKAQAVKQGSVIVTRPPYGYETVKVRGTTRKTITILRILEDEAVI